MTVDEFIKSIRNTLFSGFDSKGNKLTIRLKDFDGIFSNVSGIIFIDENYKHICGFKKYIDMIDSEKYEEISKREFVAIDEIHIEAGPFSNSHDYWNDSFIKIIIK